jgi:tRNA (guanine-N7-)-methyltransferase
VNVLGIDIRDQVVQLALARKNKQELRNVHFISTNANVDIHRILEDINSVSVVQMVAIQFPDPHFKASHRKRRVVNQDFVEVVCSKLISGAAIFIQSDVEDVMLDMVNTIQAHGAVLPAPGHDPKTLLENPKPFGINTAREIACIANDNCKIFRMMYLQK